MNMNILPLNHLREIDQPVFGVSLGNLGKLSQAGLPVLAGLAVSPPDFVLQSFLEHFQLKDRESFEQRLTFLKEEISKITLPAELEKELAKKKNFLLDGECWTSPKALWKKLLGGWLEEIRSKIWREGFNQGLTSTLTPQAVFFFQGQFFLVEAFLNPDTQEVVIESKIKMEPAVAYRIDELVLQADKKLFFPQVYQFIVRDRQVFIVGLHPFTQLLPGSVKPEMVMPEVKQKVLVKSAVKVFLNLSQGFAPAEADGCLIEGEKVADFEKAVFKISQASVSLPAGAVIYKLPDVVDGEVRGSLRLIHQQSLLVSACKLFNFVRHARNLLNVELGVPLTRSVEEFLQLKRELAAQGINRKGTLKLWLEMGTPENFINLSQYLETGLDGVILNLDYLQKCLSGYDRHEFEHYRRETQSVMTFLEPYFKLLHKARIPVLAKGILTLESEMLRFLVAKGVWGVVANSPLEATNLPEQLSWMENRMLGQ